MGKRRRKRRSVQTSFGFLHIAETDDGGIVFHTEVTGHLFTWKTPKVNASAVILPEIPCNACGSQGMIFVGAFCTKCGNAFRSAFCLTAFSETVGETMVLEGGMLQCDSCRESAPEPQRERARWN